MKLYLPTLLLLLATQWASNLGGSNLADEPAAREAGAERAKVAEVDAPQAAYTTVSLRGRVVFLAAALEKRYGIKSVPEARERVLALESASGEYTQLIEDVRGRAFRKDERLRGIDLELLARRYDGSPAVQVIQVFALENGRKYELDYWCEICAIAMFELKDCDCCQGPIELRRRPVQAQPVQEQP
jgi:hypothetical protein